MHSFQIYNLHRIAVNIVIARHISRYVSYRDLGQDTQPYYLIIIIYYYYKYYYYYLELVSSLTVFTKTAFSLGTHANMKARPFDCKKNTNICFVYVYIM